MGFSLVVQETKSLATGVLVDLDRLGATSPGGASSARAASFLVFSNLDPPWFASSAYSEATGSWVGRGNDER